jgi:hypothetical protein
VRAPFALERYLTDLRDRTAWAGDSSLENVELLHRMAHLWALALLDARFDELLLPVLATESPILDALDRESRERAWGLSREFFEERLQSGACLLLIDGADAAEWPGNLRFQVE